MRDEITKAFTAELEKQAVSVAKTLAVLKSRAAQGARVAPSILADVEKGVGASSTSAAARRVALNAADDVRLKTKMQKSLANPVVQSAHQRLGAGYEAAVRRDPGVFSNTPLPYHYDHGPAGMTPRPVAYQRVHADSLAGNSQLQDPRGLMQTIPKRQPSSSLSATVPLKPLRTAG